MKKIFTLLFVLVAMLTSANAQDSQRVMCVNAPDGNVTTLNIDDIQDITFTYDEWEKYAVGSYTYGVLWSNAYDPELTVYRSKANPNRFYIDNWGYHVPLYFTYNEATGQVTVEDQYTGYDYGFSYAGGFGHVYISETVNYNHFGEVDEDFLTSYYDADANTFYFGVLYYWAEGYIAYSGASYSLYGDAVELPYERLEITDLF